MSQQHLFMFNYLIQTIIKLISYLTNLIINNLMQSPEPWSTLKQHYQKLANVHLRDLLKLDQRNSDLITQYQNIIFDYTHEKVNQETMYLLFQLATKLGITQKIKGLFSTAKTNFTEQRAVLHTCLRAPLNSQLHQSGDNQMKDILKDVHEVLNNIKLFSQNVRSSKFIGATSKSLTNLIVIGIGGSYLSVQFVYEALRSQEKCKQLSSGRKIRFLANVDPIDFDRAIQGLNVQETLILVNSKTFTTAETILNAKNCKQWLIKSYKQLGVVDQALIAQRHICACSTNIAETSKFGINPANVFGFWDFVGGRFSVWSAIGVLPLSIHFGYEVVQSFLAGGHSIDRLLIKQSNIKKNIPIILGLIGFYRNTIQGYSTRAIIPYCQALCKFAPHIQQLDMESNGKRVNKKGQVIAYQSGVVNFGEPGTNGQHSFFQLLHQGRITPVQFIGFTKSQQPFSIKTQPVNSHDELMSNFFSQPDALAFGKTIQELTQEKTKQSLLRHKQFPGDRPSSSILFIGQLDGYKCGQLLAIYEHRTSIEGFIWDINSYDQYGVQLGKVLAKKVRGMIKQGSVVQGQLNTATAYLLKTYLDNK